MTSFSDRGFEGFERSVVPSRRHLFVSIYPSPRLPGQKEVYLYGDSGLLELKKVSYLDLQEIYRIPTDMLRPFKIETSTHIPRLDVPSSCMLAERLDLPVEVPAGFMRSALTALDAERRAREPRAREPRSQGQYFPLCLSQNKKTYHTQDHHTRHDRYEYETLPPEYAQRSYRTRVYDDRYEYEELPPEYAQGYQHRRLDR